MKDSYAAENLVPPGLRQAFQKVVDDHPGTRLEVKAFGLALHTRGVGDGVSQAASEAATAACQQWSEDLSIRRGHGIVECSVQNATKRDGLQAIMVQSGASSTLFAGDDLTDEDGLCCLGAARCRHSRGGRGYYCSASTRKSRGSGQRAVADSRCAR